MLGTTLLTSPDIFGYTGTIRDVTPRRELLKWLQGLNLTHSVKDMRRDFANGYLVAQICQRYFPNDFTLHSFDNGLSMATRRNNWGEIQRLLGRHGLSIPSSLVGDTASGQHGAATALCEHLFEMFTGKKLKPLPAESIDFTRYMHGTVTKAGLATALSLHASAPASLAATAAKAAQGGAKQPNGQQAQQQPATTPQQTSKPAASREEEALKVQGSHHAAEKQQPPGGRSVSPGPGGASRPRPGSSAANALLGSKPVARGEFEIPVEVQFGTIKMANIDNIADLRRAFS